MNVREDALPHVQTCLARTVSGLIKYFLNATQNCVMKANVFTKTQSIQICKSQVFGSVTVPDLLDSSANNVDLESYYGNSVVKERKHNETV